MQNAPTSPREKTQKVVRAQEKEAEKLDAEFHAGRMRAVEKDFREIISKIDDRIEEAIEEGKFCLNVLSYYDPSYGGSDMQDLFDRVLPYCIKHYDGKGEYTAGKYTYEYEYDGMPSRYPIVQIRWDGDRPHHDWD